MDAFEILKNINWFLEPIKDIVLFLFTTKFGFWILILLFLLYLFIPAYDTIKTRRLAYKAAASFGSGRVPLFEKIYLALGSFGRSLTKILSNIPVLVISFILLLIIVAVSSGITALDEYNQKREKILELKTVLKQLDKRYKVAEMQILDYNYKSDTTKLNLRFYDSELGDFSNQSQDIEIQGNDIYFDAIVLNFEYSQIIDKEKRNLVLPYRIFSNKVAQSDGVLLNLNDSTGVPLVYKRKENEIFGLSPEVYNKQLKEFALYLENEAEARKAGIRSSYGNAVHKRVKKGQKLVIWVEQTGGLVIKNKTDF